ncbi:MAG: beta-lactamase family protein [Candidatus Marinimicrobia bacterium]|jgi:CubicO group peptidase (beta-lactamase class C family)|nr:beta-lactamase family protein [Candidatus Neomarinimicrobiota bacterium]MBT3617661.1 beta-lactamase family protein [Candidatus Neomarinimicrobiota bacterium]MBT3829065.1 beta-lactamase family protein [Candidatus Neomarinimicrobiota bacterium]MBT3997753.1 beta-lactamase family protein [Candidatus Neomarinimicrobiota bacterium]MBT4281360.1 beta-lactamase family protein [Candidatus Neomarinimicrobiota bacterium]
MLSRRSISTAITSLIIFLFSCDDSKVKAEDELDRVAIDLLLSEYDLVNGPGAALLIIKEGDILYSNEYGMANLEEDTPITFATNFRLASVTKQFTAMCIMILKSRGQLDYEQTITDIFPDFPDYGNNITITHLLHHTSGLIEYFSLITEQVKDRDVLNLMMQQSWTYFPPGTDYRYNNSGYAILAMIVEEVSGLSFANFLEQNIFLPLGMSNSIAFEDGISIVNNRAYGYSVNTILEGPEYFRDDQSLASAVLGDGGIYTSAEDMLKWDQSLYTNTLVPYAILNKAFTSGKLSSGEETGYGFGWVLDTYYYRERVSHTGSTRGFRNVFMRFPNERISIIILTNRNSGTPKDIANQIADLLFDP